MEIEPSEKRRAFYLLRHGEPKFPDGRRYVYGGRSDYPLSPLGIEQAESVGAALAGVRFDRIFCSGMARAMQTAEIVRSFQEGTGAEIEIEPRLREIDMGEWDGVVADDIVGCMVDIFGARAEELDRLRAPGGETFIELQTRAVDGFLDIARRCEDAERVLIAAHGGTFWTVVSKLFDFDLGYMRRFSYGFCGVHIVEQRSDGSFRLARYNWAPKP